MKTLLKTLGGVLVAALLGGAAQAAEIRLGVGPNPFGAPALIVKQKGWLEEELKAAGAGDTKVSWATFTSGPPMNEALASRQIDAAFYGDMPVLLGRAAGIDLKVLGVASSGWTNNAGVVPAGSPIAAVKDLKGKKIATFKGTTAHHLLFLALAEAGLKPDDIQLVNIPITEMGTALLNGNVDAAFLWDPLLSKLEAEGAVRVLRDGKGLKNVLSLIVVGEAFAAANQPQAVALLKAYARGADFIRANPAQAAELLAPEFKLPVEVAARALSHFQYDPAFHAEELAALKGTEAYLRENGLIRTAVDVDRLVDRSVADGIGLK
ncbi:aliphatic sulfonate ABC transporter substrate-binding protein [Azospirillum sp. TSO22-1]|uniref:aliphatic sulfonate ABC transporter substrate-binding protein n=1 Tax=Azospirillum sp. TSO22-1 TaxID=716789 RepID=UPI000D61C5AC|nr:aliphatic sulfonate ABC transporter substrate-binding protein [Azospirillum sp. TSO22-1]PWC45841.1 hypothetical protein TSO221_15770 [Azospirillum sp. TSO22-1]